MSAGFFWIIFSFLVYGLVHSWMASLSFKAFLERRWPQAYRRFYRLFYNVFSALTFLPILYMNVVFPNAGLYQVPAPWGWVLLGVEAAALVCFGIALLQTDLLSFAGLRQAVSPAGEAGPSGLVTTGFYRLVRHPLYLFGILFLWANPHMSWNGLAFNIGATLYLLIGMIFEERKLLREFGEDYARYQHSVPALLPFTKIHK